MSLGNETAGVAWEAAPELAGAGDNLEIAEGGRKMIVAAYGAAQFDIVALNIDVPRVRVLYLLLELPSPAQITVFYRTRGRADFGDDRTALATPPTFHAGPHAYRLDMGSMPGWTEEIEGLRVRLEGLMAGATVGFGGVVGTTGPLEELPGQESAWPVAAVAAQTPYRGERFAACSRTVVSIDEVTAAVGLSTYIKNPQESNPFGLNFDPQSQFGLARVAAGVVAGDRELTDRDAGAVRVSPQPGTLLAQLDFAGEQVHVQVTPLRPLSDTDRAEGAMLYRIRSSSGAPLWVTCGQMAPMTVWERGLWLRTGKPPHEAGTATIHESLGLLTHSDIPAVVVFRPGPGATELRVCDGGASGYVRFERGEGWLVVAFAADRARALELARIEPLAAEQASLAYFDEVFSHFRIKTPEPLLDEAFRTAWLTMDYSWVQPYGCTESLHHWWAIWQQYPSASFDWAGLACRTRESILSHAQRQYKSGNIPYLLYFGERHSDFGGNNQTFMWQVQHYLRSTGDAALAREILPEMRRLVDAFWRYEDLDGNRVPGFGVQVLTQEDYVATPRDGTSSAVVGVEMWRTLALVEQMSGNGERAIACQSRAREAAAGWRERLWQRELGRPAYFIDGLDQVRPDGQYHTLVLPVVYDLLNPLDAYTSIRHMTDRLVGPQGELYYSNNFPNHIGGARSSPFSPTWGMQAGAYMQPWAAWAYNRIGARNEAVRSLAVVARWATMFPHQDAWPESSTELTPAYFSNTAASYAQAVIEAVFGLQQDHSVSTLRVQPAFPDAWEAAEIDLAPLQAKYERHGDSFRYTIHTATPLRRCMRWPLPVCRVEKVEVNGIPCTFTTEQAVGGIWLMVTTEALEDTDIVFTMTPVAWSVAHAGSLAEGETMQATAAGCRIVGVDDPLQLVAETSWQEHGVELRLTDNRLAPWLRFGRLGQLNFARRTVFLRCEAAGQAFWAPVNFSLLPPYEAAPATDLVPADGGYDLSVTLRNNTSRLLAGTGTAFWAGGEAPLQISVAPRSDATLRVRTARHHLAQLAPGDNPLRLVLPTGSELQLACPVTGLFENLTDGIEAAVHPIPFLDGQLMTDEGWREFAAFPVFWQGPYNELPRPMDAIRGQKSVSCAALPGIAFPIADGGRIAVASRRLTRPAVVVDVGQTFRKVYLLVLSFAENHDAFTQCARVTVTCKADFERSPFDATDEPVQWTRARYDRLVVRRGLCTPGDLDSWMPEPHVGPLATARLERPDRYGLLTLLGPHNADWPEGVPLAGPYGLFAMLEPPPRDRWPEGTFRSFPQPQFWASCPTMRTASATFNIVEVDLLRPRHVLSIEVACPLQDSAVALVSAVGLEGASIPPSAEQ